VPIIRKLTTIGDSRGITIPKSWIENAESKAKKKIVAIAMEIDGIINLRPVFEEKSEELW
jgi:bifunctional DNA-binding transcriptional regulator/antitoxin component of YhaV-PrlF toxin-antitoxin module